MDLVLPIYHLPPATCSLLTCPFACLPLHFGSCLAICPTAALPPPLLPACSHCLLAFSSCHTTCTALPPSTHSLSLSSIPSPLINNVAGLGLVVVDRHFWFGLLQTCVHTHLCKLLAFLPLPHAFALPASLPKKEEGGGWCVSPAVDFWKPCFVSGLLLFLLYGASFTSVVFLGVGWMGWWGRGGEEQNSLCAVLPTYLQLAALPCHHTAACHLPPPIPPPQPATSATCA